MTDEELKALVASLAISQAKTDQQIKELSVSFKKRDEEYAKIDQELTRKIDKLWKLFWDFWNTRWEKVEEFFYRYFEKNKELQWNF